MTTRAKVWSWLLGSGPPPLRVDQLRAVCESDVIRTGPADPRRAVVESYTYGVTCRDVRVSLRVRKAAQ